MLRISKVGMKNCIIHWQVEKLQNYMYTSLFFLKNDIWVHWKVWKDITDFMWVVMIFNI